MLLPIQLPVPDTRGALSGSLSLLGVDQTSGLSLQLSPAGSDDSVAVYGGVISNATSVTQLQNIVEYAIPGASGNGAKPVFGVPPTPFPYIYALRTGGITTNVELLVSGQETSGTVTPTPPLSGVPDAIAFFGQTGSPLTSDQHFVFDSFTGNVPAGLAFLDDTLTQQFHFDRQTGTIIVGSPDPVNGGKGQWFLNQTGPLGGSTSPVQMSYASKSLGFRVAQYGNGARTANFGFFRSRGTNIGDLAACIDGDSLMNFTCSGVTGNNINVPLAGIFDCVIPVGGVFTTTITPDFRWQLAGGGGINSRRVVWFMQGATGDLIMSPKAAASTQEERIRIRDAQASAGASVNAMQGIATTGAGSVVVVPNTLITANTRISLTWQGGGAAPTGTPYDAGLRAVGISFTIASTNPADVGCVVFWQLWEPAP